MSIALPFFLLRPLIRPHEPTAHKSPNQEVAQDRTIFTYVAMYGAVVYAVTIYASLYTWLPVYLITHFKDVRSMEMAHASSVAVLMVLFVPIGFASAEFLFMPAIGTRGNPGLTDPALKPHVAKFNPEKATFGETIAWNLGFGEQGWSKRAEVLAKRTLALVGCSFANNVVRIYWTVEGTTLGGALGYAGMWAVAGAATGLAYAYVGNE